MFKQFRFTKTLEPKSMEEDGERRRLLNSETLVEPNAFIVNPSYQYDGNDIVGILSVKLKALEAVCIYSPNYIVGNTSISLRQYLEEERKISNRPKTRKLLIPYNIEDRNWIAVVVSIKDSSVAHITYIDIVGHYTQEAKHIIDLDLAIKEASIIYPNLSSGMTGEISIERNFLDDIHPLSSSGPLTVENLLTVASDIPLEPKNISEQQLNDIRLDHIVSYYKYNIQYYEKQLRNKAAVSFLEENWPAIIVYNLNNYELLRITYIVKILKEMNNLDIELAVCRAGEEHYEAYCDRTLKALNKIRYKIALEYSTNDPAKDMFSDLVVNLIFVNNSNVFAGPDYDAHRIRIGNKATRLIRIIKDFDLVEFSRFQRALDEQIKNDLFIIESLKKILWREKYDFNTLTTIQALGKSINFAGPIFLANITGTTLGLLNMSMLANLGNSTVAASSLISTLQAFIVSTSCSVLCSIGITASRTPQVNMIDPIYKKGLLCAVILSVPSIILTLNSENIFNIFGQDEEITKIVQSYFTAYSIGLPAYFIFSAGQQIAIGKQKKYLFGISSAFNALLTTGLGYVLIYGKFNLPALGISGLGYANSISVFVSLIGFNLYIKFAPSFKLFSLTPFSFKNIFNDFDILKNLLKTGIPIGVQVGSEVIALPVSSTIVGLIGVEELSAHQVVTQWILWTLTAYFSIGQGCSSLLGNAAKGQHFLNIRKLGNSGILLGMSLSTLMLILFSTTPKSFISPFIDIEDPNNSGIIDMCQKLLIIGGIGQLLDSIRIITGSALQGGFNDTFLTMITGVSGMCVLALPLGYALGLPAGLGVSGVHLARDLGIALGSATLLYRWYSKVTTAIEEINRTNQLDKRNYTIHEATDASREISDETPTTSAIKDGRTFLPSFSSLRKYSAINSDVEENIPLDTEIKVEKKLSRRFCVLL